MKEIFYPTYTNNYTQATFTSSTNKYHEDDIINDFIEFVRYTKLESDAIKNIKRILEKYDRKKKYTLKEKFKILFS